MRGRLASFAAAALGLFLLGQPLALGALARAEIAARSCCKDACCCRRSHGLSKGSAWAAAPSCGYSCHHAARSIGRLPAVVPSVAAQPLRVRLESHGAPRPLYVRNLTEHSLYQRPPPAGRWLMRV